MLIIGELINATRKSVKKAILDKNDVFIKELACKQAEAGADYIDVNVATGVGKQEIEIENMEWVVKQIKSVCDKPLAIDTTSRDVLEAGLRAHGPGAMVNSISAEDGRLYPFLELARDFDCVAVALPVQDSGIPKDVSLRIDIAASIIEAARQENFPVENLLFDPLVIPLGVDDKSTVITLKTLRSLKDVLKVKTVMGLTNISHGLPERSLLNRTFLTMAIEEGLDAVIISPLCNKVMSSLLAAEAFKGNDPFCGNYLKAYRQGLLNSSQ